MSQDTDLRTAEDHVSRGELHVARQRQIIEMKRGRRQTTEFSERILETLEVSLALHREHLDQLRASFA